MKYQLNIIILLIILSVSGCSKPDKYEIVIQNVAFFDGEQDRGIVNIGINADTIAAISQEKLQADEVIEAKGKFLMPGMVNAHIHATSVEELKEGYNIGILANLNMHTGNEEREMEWKKMTMDSAGFPILYGSGHAGTVPGGHPNQFSPDMETINDTIGVQQWVDNRITNGADYIKIVRENHPWMEHPAQPTLSYEQIHKIIDYAQSKGYLAVIHATQAKDFVEIAKFKPDGFAHMWDFKLNSDLSPEDYQAIANSGAFIIPTAGISMKSNNPPAPIAEWLEQNMLSAEERQQVINKLHSLDILLVAGTDAQRGQMNFGDDFYYELEIYKQAGLSNIEVLKTATGNAAKAFNLPVGSLKVGSKAHMVLLSANPIEDLDNLKQVEQVWKNGQTE